MIKQAAIKDINGEIWTLPRPARHHNIIKAMYDVLKKTQGDREKEIQGFITEDNIFVNRELAAEIAIKSNQPRRNKPYGHGGKIGSMLLSEDLW